jgi:hypothetical protein
MLSENEGFPPQADQGSGFSNKKCQITKRKSQTNHNDRSAGGGPNNWRLILFEIWILRFGIYL